MRWKPQQFNRYSRINYKFNEPSAMFESTSAWNGFSDVRGIILKLTAFLKSSTKRFVFVKIAKAYHSYLMLPSRQVSETIIDYSESRNRRNYKFRFFSKAQFWLRTMWEFSIEIFFEIFLKKYGLLSIAESIPDALQQHESSWGVEGNFIGFRRFTHDRNNILR